MYFFCLYTFYKLFDKKNIYYELNLKMKLKTTTKINMMSYNYKINKTTTVKPYWKLVPFYSKNVFSVGCPL